MILKRRSAQGDVATLNRIMDAVRTEASDMLVTFSTPTLQTVIKNARCVQFLSAMPSSPARAAPTNVIFRK